MAVIYLPAFFCAGYTPRLSGKTLFTSFTNNCLFICFFRPRVALRRGISPTLLHDHMLALVYLRGHGHEWVHWNETNTGNISEVAVFLSISL